jgi:hypothetical protein
LKETNPAIIHKSAPNIAGKKRSRLKIHRFLPAAVHTTHGEKLPERKQTPEMRGDAHAAAATKLRNAKTQVERYGLDTAIDK